MAIMEIAQGMSLKGEIMPSELHLLTELTQLILSVRELKQEFLQKTEDACESALLNYRETTRSKLLFTQNELSSCYSKKITNYILFPIISNIDERCKLMLSECSSTLTWHDLQIEFFQRSDGGEYVFEILDDVISNKIYPKICYEVLLIVLQDGFLGKYYHNPNHNERHQYVTSLKEILADMNGNTLDMTNNKVQKTVYKMNDKKIRTTIGTIIAVAILLPLGIYLLT